MKIAVIGSGIAGLSCAYRLAVSGLQVTLYEANSYFGGHTNTVEVTLEGQTYGVDTGFLVFNHRTYPTLVKLFEELAIATVATTMSFSVKMPIAGAFGVRTLEWAGANLDSVFSQRRNLLNPGYLRMLRDILRFNRQATALALDGMASLMPLGHFLDQYRYSQEFRNWYLLPMAGCIWSCPTAKMMEFPVASFIRFCHNHGLLQVSNRPQWQTVQGGARHYVEKMLAAIPLRHLQTPVTAVSRLRHVAGYQISVETSKGCQLYDHVVMAGHSDQSLRLLEDASTQERRLLGSIKYQPNQAVLHTDTSLLPRQRKAWAAWNYQSSSSERQEVCVHYLLNQLQPLPFKTPLMVSLNPIEAPAAASVIDSFEYAHPVFDANAIDAQRQFPAIQGQRNTWFSGAWLGYGFHEDGLKSGQAVAQAIQEIAAAPASEVRSLAA